MTERKCSTCKETKPLNEEHFHRCNRRGKQGFQYNCIECATKRAANWNKENLQRVQETAKLRRCGMPVREEQRAAREEWERATELAW